MELIQPVILPETLHGASGLNYTLDVYRGDLEHPEAPGNKWHKLQHHLKAAKQQGAKVIATFGGPFSNHLHAFSATLKDSNMKALAVVRGELHPQLNSTLRSAALNGIELWPSLRRDYKLAMDAEVVQIINGLYENIYWIPEGGGGELGALGCMEWAEHIDQLDNSYDAWVVSAGTGTTAAGLLAYDHIPDLHVISALKGASEQDKEILELADCVQRRFGRHTASSKEMLKEKLFFHSNEHHGGYAKHSAELMSFLERYAIDNARLPLDPVYTCKSMYSIMLALEQGAWPYARTLFIHSGGLQGWGGYSDDKNPFLKA